MRRFRLYILGCVLICLLLFGVISWLGTLFYPAIVRVELAGSGTRLGFVKFLKHWKAVDILSAQVTQCRESLEKMDTFRSASALLEKENSELKTLLRFVERERLRVITAEVYGYGVPGDFKAFFNVGTEDGVELKDPIIGTSGNLIGLISEVEQRRSIITFISSPDIALPIITNNSAISIGVTQGGKGNEISIGLIPQQQVVTVGDDVLLPSSATVLERELYLGYVDSVTKSPSDIFQTAIVIIPEPFTMITKASVTIQ